MYRKKEQEEELREEKDDYRNLISPHPAIPLNSVSHYFQFCFYAGL